MRPLPVDDEPHWLPAKDPGASEGLDGDPDHAATTGVATPGEAGAP